jgi:hypothetical protein
MPSISVNLPRSHVDDLVAVCRIGTVRLNQIADALHRMPLALKRSEIRRVIASAAGDGQETQVTDRVLGGLAIAIRHFNVPAGDLLDKIQISLFSSNLSEEDKSSWHECRPIIEKMLSASSLRSSVKARELSYDFDNIYAQARILVDIRPVFDDVKEVIIGADITHTLRLEYITEGDDTTILSVAMDRDDIRKLQECCEEALRKSDKAISLVQNQKLEAFTPGGESE